MLATFNLSPYVAFVRTMAQQSVCKRRGVAACIMNEDQHMIGWGINGPAAYDSKLCTGKKDACFCLHSELNAILNARPSDLDRERGCLMLCTREPCPFCASIIVNCQFIKSVIFLDNSEQGPIGTALLRDNQITCNIYAGESSFRHSSTTSVAPDPTREPQTPQFGDTRPPAVAASPQSIQESNPRD